VTIPVGMAKIMTRRRKPGTYRRRFGPSASRNPGMPIVTAEISVSWMGASGYAATVTAVISASTSE